MTRKLSISVPDDVATWLDGQANVSSTITDLIRAHLAAQSTAEILRRAGFDPSTEGKRRWRARLADPVPAHAIESGEHLIGRTRPDLAGA